MSVVPGVNTAGVVYLGTSLSRTLLAFGESRKTSSLGYLILYMTNHGLIAENNHRFRHKNGAQVINPRPALQAVNISPQLPQSRLVSLVIVQVELPEQLTI